ncbi:MAG: hypothetical protein A3J24_09325, partial [Deltaproteobacteria bacterium RIFCSPLOWO2_02_FULL_53_8]
VSRCPYCDFNSVADGSAPQARYISALSAEAACIVRSERLNRPIASIYIGGGTPSLFSPKAVGRILDTIKASFSSLYAPSIEITIEVNPDSATLERLQGYMDVGVNRLSIGMQSFNNRILKTLGRPHTAQEALAVYDFGRKAGFRNIGIDLIFGVSGQTMKDWMSDVRQVIDLGPEHISLYGLTIEEGTAYARLYKDSRLVKLSEELEIEMYSAAVSRFKDAGWTHYEISNLSRPGFKSVHNSAYWHGGDYIGIGAGAHSYLSEPDWGRRWWNLASPQAYMTAMETRTNGRAGTETLTEEEAVTETVMLRLRALETGMDNAAFQERFGKSIKEALPAWNSLAANGLIEDTGKSLRLTAKGVLISNEVFLRLKGV